MVMQLYYYQQEQVRSLVNKEYMIWLEMYMNGHLKKLLIRAVLVLYEEAIISVQVEGFQLLTVTTTVRPVTVATSVLGFHFSKLYTLK